MAIVLLLFFSLLFVVWLRDVRTMSPRRRRSRSAMRARHRKAGTIGVCLILGCAALWYGSLLVAGAFRTSPPSARQTEERLSDYAERSNARFTLEDLRRRYGTQALP